MIFWNSRTVFSPTKSQFQHLIESLKLMEVYDLTGERTMLNKEEAEKIAAVIVENATTLKKVILKTKTYKAEVARIIGGILTIFSFMDRSIKTSYRN